MLTDAELSSTWVYVGGVLGFVGLWALVCLIISRGGWAQLAKRYTCFSPLQGARISWESLSMRGMLARYHRCVTFYLSPEGLRIAVMPIFAIGHPPLFFGWRQMKYLREEKAFLKRQYLYDLGAPRVGRMKVSRKMHEAIQSYLRVH